jgi:hypothetical protein
MAFGKITKDDLIAAGLDPDKLKEFQEKGVTKDDLATMKTEIATSINDLIKAQFAELEGKMVKPPVTRTENNDDGHKKTPEELEEERQGEFLSNPTGYVDRQVQKLGFAANVEFKKQSRTLAMKDAKRTLRGFNNPIITAEIETEWAKYTPEIMARNGTDPELLLTQIHDMIIGKHHDEIMQDRDKKDGKFNLVHSGGGGGGGAVNDTTRDRQDNKDVISPEDQAQAKKFGMTDAEWMAERAGLEEDKKYVAAGGRV